MLPEGYESEGRFITPGAVGSSSFYIGVLQSRIAQDRLILRQIPVVEAGYADAARPAAIEEAVFDTLTQENELAKMSEVRNTQSIRVSDSPGMSENKSGLSAFGSFA